jgi:hypothetical protein
VRHVRFDKVASSKCGAQAQLSRKNSGSDNSSKLPSIVTWVGGVGTTDTEQIKHGRLPFKNSATTNCANFDGRHRHSDLEVAIEAGKLTS